MIKSIWYRLMHNREGWPLNPLIYIFFYLTAVNGIFFTFLTSLDTVQQSVLYQHTRDAFGTMPLPIWGVCAMLAVAINLTAILGRHRKLLGYGGMLGFGVWLFAGFIYVQDLLWFQALVGAVPNLIFWAWYYFRVKWYYK